MRPLSETEKFRPILPPTPPPPENLVTAVVSCGESRVNKNSCVRLWIWILFRGHRLRRMSSFRKFPSFFARIHPLWISEKDGFRLGFLSGCRRRSVWTFCIPKQCFLILISCGRKQDWIIKARDDLSRRGLYRLASLDCLRKVRTSRYSASEKAPNLQIAPKSMRLKRDNAGPRIIPPWMYLHTRF